jgi:hypothetical protein
MPTPSTNNKPKPKTIERPKHILEMEERAKARKDKREQLKKAY